MALKRRGFLTMLGAAIAAPAASLDAPSIHASLAKRAAIHARTYPFVSATGLANRLGLSMAEAQSVLVDLSRKGLVGAVRTGSAGPLHAASRVFTPASESLIKAAQARKAAQQARAARRAAIELETKRQFHCDLTHFLKHLQSLCANDGIAVQPRAMAAAT